MTDAQQSKRKSPPSNGELEWRTRMENFHDNFKGGRTVSLCAMCQKHPNSQSESFQCLEIRKPKTIDADYDDIFYDSPSLNTVKTI